MAQQKEILIKINVDDKSLDQLTSELKGVGAEIKEINNVGNQLTIDQKFMAADGAIKTFTGAVAAAVGAIGLLGIESKVFEEYERYALSVIAFSRGIFDLSEGFKKLRQSTVLANIVIKANNALNIATAATMRALGIATSATSTAFVGLKAAIAGTGIGLLIVAIGFAVQKLIEFADANKSSKQATDNFNESLKENKALLDEQAATLKEDLETRLLQLEEIGATEKQLEEARRENHENLLTRFQEAEDKALQAVDLAKKLSEEELKAAEQSLAGIQKARNKAETDELQRGIRQRITVANQAKEDAKKAAEEAKKNNESIVKLAQEKADAEFQILQETAISVEQLQFAELEAVNNKYDRLIALANEYGLLTISIENKRQSELTKLFQKFENEEIQALTETDSTIESLFNESMASYIRQLELLGTESLDVIEESFALRLRELTNQEQIELEAAFSRYQAGLIEEENFQELKYQIIQKYENLNTEAILQNNADIAESNMAFDDAILQSKLSLYSQIGAAFGNLSQLFEQGTAAAKQAALAEVAINTAVGFVQGLDIAQKGAAGTGPAAPFAFPIFYASQIAAVLGAAVQAKNILSTSRSGGVASGVAETGSPGRSFQQGTTVSPGLFDFESLPQGQLVSAPRTQQGSLPIRAYVLAQDVQTETEARDRLNLKRNLT